MVLAAAIAMIRSEAKATRAAVFMAPDYVLSPTISASFRGREPERQLSEIVQEGIRPGVR
jgi:hypothetical protein